MAAEPVPASLEKAARRKPTTSTPMKPPVMAVGLKASETIVPIAAGTSPAWIPRIHKQAST